MPILDRVRPAIREMAGYVPGEQPQNRPIVKLNTNENPFPPPKAVLDAMIEASHRLRLYPEPTARPVRQAAARLYGLHEDQVVVGNGSDDLLTLILRTFIDKGQVVTAPDPTYSLYKTLTQIQGGTYVSVPWEQEGKLPIKALLATEANVIFVVRPNSPTGHAVALEEVSELCSQAPGAVVLDEAYVDFCSDNGLALLSEYENLIITRTFSKSLSLAGLRLGLGFMNKDVAIEMHKVRDSYNVDGIAQAAAVAALDHRPMFDEALEEIKTQRERTHRELWERGFQVEPSEANFVLATIPNGARDGDAWLNDLRELGYLVRYFGSHPDLVGKLRISIGSEKDMDGFLDAVDRLLEDN